MAGINLAVSEDAVATLNEMAAQLTQSTEDLKKEVETLKQVYEDNRDGLGAHLISIENLLEDIKGTEEGASTQVKKLVLKLTRSAAIRQKHIIEDHYSTLRRSR